MSAPGPDAPPSASNDDGAPLCTRTCKACRGDVPKLSSQDIFLLFSKFAAELPGWKVAENPKNAEGAGELAPDTKPPDAKLYKVYNFKKNRKAAFVNALQLANKIGGLAEEVGHHPDLVVGWGRCGVEFWTHAVGGVTEADFIAAAKVENLVGQDEAAKKELL